MLGLPVLAIACVIDRPGHDARYRVKYGRLQWQLCQTAFAIVVERSCKRAITIERRLRVCPERCSKKEDRRLSDYYRNLCLEGFPFEAEPSAAYKPLTQAQFAATLYDLDFKYKSSPMAQLADLYLWPQVMGGSEVSADGSHRQPWPLD